MNPATQDIIEQTSIQERNLAVLLQHFPGVVSTNDEGELVINTDKLKLALDPKARIEENGYELNWVGKKEAYHTAYAKQAKILQPLAADSKLLDGGDMLSDSTQNLLIKGDNLQALKLLKASYFEQIKMIYIDPPYNTKSENFIYRDNFSESEAHILDELGYSPDYKDYIKNIQGARTHSGWLSFMFPRLLLARDLLKEEGVIFISIDDNEQANLKLLCDEVFGEVNFVANIVWQRAFSPKNDAKFLSENHDYMLIYCKNNQECTIGRLKRSAEADARYKNLDNDPRGIWISDNLTVKTYSEKYDYPITTPSGRIVSPAHGSCWRVSKEKFLSLVADNRIWFGEDGANVPRLKRFLTEVQQGMVPTTLWLHQDVGHNQEARQELKALFDDKGYFDGPKPIRLINRVLQIANTQENDIILDFFAGSGTTGQAVMELNAEDGGNRQFILVQLPEVIDAKKQASSYHFVTQTLGKTEATIFEITAERLRRAGEKVKQDHADKPHITTLDVGFKAFTLADDPMHRFYKPLHEVSAQDLAQLEMALSSEAVLDSLPTRLVNLLLAEKLPLSTPIVPLIANAVYQAANVLLIVADITIDELKAQLAQAAQPIEYVSIYSPSISGNRRDQFVQTLKPALAHMGLDESRLSFRG